jgi:hypothetical protein
MAESRGKQALHLFGNEIAPQAAGAKFKGNRGSPNFGFYFDQIRLPGAAGMILRMTYLIAGYRMFSADIAGS